MTDPALSLPEAARRLGVSPRALRQAIRGGQLSAPPRLSATATLPPEWLASAQAALEASPGLLRHRSQKIAPFARYEGTSAWRKYRVRVHAYARFRAEADRPAG